MFLRLMSRDIYRGYGVVPSSVMFSSVETTPNQLDSTDYADRRIGVIGGAGNMGSCILDHIIGKTTEAAIGIKFPNDLENCRTDVHVYENVQDLVEQSDTVIISVKPRDINCVIRDINEVEHADKLFISVAAGIPYRYYRRNLQGLTIRLMPSHLLSVDSGIIGYMAPRKIREKYAAYLEYLFATSRLYLCPNDAYMDLITVMGASSPAIYANLLAKIHTAISEMGIDDNIAEEMLINTFRGSIDYIERYGFNKLINSVTSPGGVTEEGLKIMDNGDLNAILEETFTQSYYKCCRVRDEFTD